MTRVLVAAALILVAITLYGFFDCLLRDRALVRVMPKWAWLLVVLLVPLFGVVLWYLFGRSSFGSRKARGPVAPDDDPDYLQKIADEVEQAERRKRREEMERRTAAGEPVAHERTAPAAETPAEELDPHAQFERWLAERDRKKAQSDSAGSSDAAADPTAETGTAGRQSDEAQTSTSDADDNGANTAGGR